VDSWPGPLRMAALACISVLVARGKYGCGRAFRRSRRAVATDGLPSTDVRPRREPRLYGRIVLPEARKII
jgi:hypothetical protein